MTKAEKRPGRSIPRGRVLEGTLIGVAAAFIAVTAGFLNFSDKLELMTLDARFRMRPPVETLPEIGFIDYDDASLQLCGEWPWPRYRQVALVNTLARYDARMAGFDVFFVDEENTRLLADRMKRALLPGSSAGADTGRLINEAFINYDREFAAALRRARNMYLAYSSADPDEKDSAAGSAGIAKITAERRKSHVGIRKKALEEIEKTFLRVPGKGVEKALIKTVDVDAPLPVLAAAAKGTGFAQPGIDGDSVKRNYSLFRYYNGSMMYSITMKMLSDLLDFKLSDVEIHPGENVVLRNALDYRTKRRMDIKIPVDEHGQFLLNWAGTFDKTYLHIPFRILSYYYAYDTAKQTVRGLPPTTDAGFTVIRDRLFNSIMDEEMAPREEARRIATEIAAAHFITRFSTRGMRREEIMKKLGGYCDAALLKAVYESVAAAGIIEKDLLMRPDADFIREESKVKSEGLEIDRERLGEIYRNMAFFSGKKALQEARPYYFPPVVRVNSGGKISAFSPVDLKDKIFMVGLTGMNTIDLKPSPFEENVPLVAYHVNALNTVLTGNYLRAGPPYFKYAAALLLSLLIGVAGMLLSIPVSFGIAASLAAGYLFGVYKMWVVNGIRLDIAVPLSGMLLTYTVVVIAQFVRAFREKKKVRGIFGAMVSPAVLKIMEEHPDKFSLTGERKPATTFFSMINGIGNVTKTVAPDELTTLLSVYLTPNSEIIMDYDGYIDKYEGHVIMADFGAPLDDGHNPWKCAFAAVEQWIDIEAFRYFVKAKYGLDVGVSMGFNYGYVSAGNMGSERKFQYTVMGDPVNVAARFMASNFIYNADYAITGEDTVPVIDDYVYLRALDKVLLKGKTKPTAIYNVLGWKPEAYMKMRGKRPVPGYLGLLWAKCPPEKIFGYRHLWSRKFEETGHPLAKDIRDFFSGSLDTARVLLVNGWKTEIHGYGARIEAVVADLRSRMTVPDLPEQRGDYREMLDTWTIYLRDLLNAVYEEGLTSPDLKSDILVVLNKVDMLKTRLEQDIPLDEMIDESMRELKDFIPRWREAPVEQLEKTTAEALNGYRRAVGEFCRTLENKREPYHEMMSLAGAPGAQVLSAREYFEEGLALYWLRRWDEALEKFRLIDIISPGEGPVVSLIERIEGYRLSPPGENWQGEFVQTKK